MQRARRCLVVAVLTAAICLPGSARAQDDGRDFALGLRFGVVAAGGEPTNDIPAAGVTGRYRLNDRWWLGLGLDRASGFDVERPYEFLGLVGAAAAGEVDAKADSTTLSAWIERVYGRPGGRLEWFWGLGAGLASVEVEDVAGPLEGGGRYDIANDVGTEILGLAGAGFRVRMGSRWAFEGAVRAEEHFTDWTTTDRVSGRSAALDDYLATGGHVGFVFRF